MFQTHTTPIHDRITPAALLTKVSDPRVSDASKRASLEHAMRAAMADGDDATHSELLVMWRGVCGLTSAN